MTEPNEQDLPEPDDTPLAPDEAEQAEAEEAEQPEPDEAEQPAPDAEPELAAVAQPVTPEEHDVRVAKIGKSFANYTKRFEELFEADAENYFGCPMCMGETPGFLNRGVMGRFPEQQADVIKQVLGLARPIEYKRSSKHRTCVECGGEGKVDTGSEVPKYKNITCEDCGGRGFTGPTPVAPLAQSNGSEGMTGPTVYSEPTPPADSDEWAQPRLLPDGRDNPNFGRMPNHWIQVEPWGDTRGLTAQDAVRG